MLEQLRALLSANRARRAAAYADMEAMADLTESESRNLTLDEDKVFQGLIDEIKGLDAIADDLKPRLDELEELDRGIRAANKAVPLSSDPMSNRGLRPSSSPRTPVQGAALRSLELSHQRGLGDDATHEAITKVIERDTKGGMSPLIAATADPDYFSAFVKRFGSDHGYQLWSDRERAAYQRVHEVRETYDLGSNLGSISPIVIDPAFVLSGAGSISPFRQICKTVNIPYGNTHRTAVMPQLSGAIFAEGAESTDSGTQIAAADVTIFTSRCMAVCSMEILADLPQLASELGAAFADSRANLEVSVFTTGNGTTAPQGIVTALTGGASEVNAAGEALAIADLFGLYESLPARHQGRASWQMNISTLNRVRQLDTSGGSTLLARLGEGSPERLIGQPLYTNSAMDGSVNAAATANNYAVVVGDFQKMVIVDSGPTIIMDQDLTATANNLPNGLKALTAWGRFGSKVVDIDAFRMLDIATTA